MPPTEDEILSARLARMKLLVDDLERVSTESVAHRELFAKLRREMDAARDALKLHKSARVG